MAPPPTRARSNTSGSVASNRPRPISRASTTSLHTPSTQAIQQYPFASDISQLAAPRQYEQSQFRYQNPDPIIPKPQRQSASQNRDYVIDPSLESPPVSAHVVGTDHIYSTNHGAMPPVSNDQNAFEARQNEFPANFNDENIQSDPGAGDIKKKKGSASSIANDQELRKLFRENHHRDLKDVAAEVLVHERGPKSEKTKQIFAMNWLNTVCVKSNSSVPRNRVFSHYARRCGTERVPPLNPASFGKLVRIIFPGIQTRRLGQRGWSKYHYVDLALTDDRMGSQEDELPPETGSFVDNQSVDATRSYLAADTAVFPLPETSLDRHSRDDDNVKLKAVSHLYLDDNMQRIHQDPAESNMVRRLLKFPSGQESSYAHDEPFILPRLTDYLPDGTDPDASEALTALYQTHCISVIDCFRFCKERMFWHHFTSFHGTLTVPVQKLLAHSKVAAWITECDWLMYQKMIHFISPLALQVIPIKIIDTFRNIAAKLVQHISYTFQSQPDHTRDAKIGPASIFAGLVNRLLRVNATAHAAANMLTNDANRDQMWHDWVCFVKPTGVVESSLPCCGYTSTIQILLLEVGELLGPLRSNTYQGMQQIFVNAQADPGPDYHPIVRNELDDSSTSGVLDRWTTFLHDLPSRFPRVDARVLLWCVGEVGSACIRDITMAQALSFGSWWVTKVWVDEMLRWIAEKGGFLESGPDSMSMRPKKRTAGDAGFGNDDRLDVGGASRPRTGNSEIPEVSGFHESTDVADGAHGEGPDTNAASQHISHSQTLKIDAAEIDSKLSHPRVNKAELDQMQDHDDSGIGLDLEVHQNTPIRLADYGGFVANGGSSNSDPTDVVVC